METAPSGNGSRSDLYRAS